MKLGSILTVVTIATVSVAGAGIAGAFNKGENESLGEEKGKQAGDSVDVEKKEGEEKLRVCPNKDNEQLQEDENTCILSTPVEN